MEGLFSIESWEKVWTFRSTFMLGLLNSGENGVICFDAVPGAGYHLRIDGHQQQEAFKGNKPRLCGVDSEHTRGASACFLYYALAFSGNSLGIITTGTIALGSITVPICPRLYERHWLNPQGQFEAADSQGLTT
jgi:putative glutamine transport system permease protein